MAKAQFHKNQRVYVRPVGTWALIERIVPHWTKGLEEPIRIFYDVGLGREFSADELQPEANVPPPGGEEEERWRVVRAQNKWQSPPETTNHPHPGTYPAVVTGEAEWGGWRVPGAEYAVSPDRVEKQARMIALAPRLASIVKKFAEWTQQTPEAVPEALSDLAQESGQAVAYLKDGVAS